MRRKSGFRPFRLNAAQGPEPTFVTGAADGQFQLIVVPPQVVPLAIDFRKHLIKMPSPTARLHPLDPALSDLCDKHRAKPVPQVANGFVALIHATFIE